VTAPDGGKLKLIPDEQHANAQTLRARVGEIHVPFGGVNTSWGVWALPALQGGQDMVVGLYLATDQQGTHLEAIADHQESSTAAMENHESDSSNLLKKVTDGVQGFEDLASKGMKAVTDAAQSTEDLLTKGLKAVTDEVQEIVQTITQPGGAQTGQPPTAAQPLGAQSQGPHLYDPTHLNQDGAVDPSLDDADHAQPQPHRPQGEHPAVHD
jgi:hypothetical protein